MDSVASKVMLGRVDGHKGGPLVIADFSVLQPAATAKGSWERPVKIIQKSPRAYLSYLRSKYVFIEIKSTVNGYDTMAITFLVPRY